MADARFFLVFDFCGADVESFVDLGGVGGNHFPVQRFCEQNRKRAFARGRWTDDGDEFLFFPIRYVKTFF